MAKPELRPYAKETFAYLPCARRFTRLPPMNPDDPFALVRLHLATVDRGGLGQRLLERFGRASEVFRRPAGELSQVRGVTATILKRLNSTDAARQTEKEFRRCEREKIDILIQGTADYPSPLNELPEMPLVLFVRGCWESKDRRAVGIVGSRRPSPYGIRQAKRFAGRFAEWGVTVVSGLARGIDGVAQEEALENSGRTIAVFGCGLGRIYPPEHFRLAERIVSESRGALLSEFSFKTPPRSHHFPQRNRLISGLSSTLFVVEAGEKSGSLITVDWALRQGRSVYVLPGRVDEAQAVGTLALLRDGAIPALKPEDLRAELGLPPSPATPESPSEGPTRSRQPAFPGPLGSLIEQLFLEADIWHADRLADRLRLEPSQVLLELARLEIEGYLERGPEGGYRRAI